MSLFFVLIWLVPAAKNNLFNSLTTHTNLIQNVKPSNNQWFILERLFLELLPIIVLCFGVFSWELIKKKNKLYLNGDHIKKGLFWLGIGCSGSLPILLSGKASGYYLVPALSFLALGLGAFIIPIFNSWNENAFKKVTFFIKD